MTAKPIQAADLSEIACRVEQEKQRWSHRVLVCGDTGCRASGSHGIHRLLKKEIEDRGLANSIEVMLTGCNGFCSVGPMLTIYPGGVWYQQLTAKDVPEIVEEHLGKGRFVERLMFKDPVTKEPVPGIDRIPYFTGQHLNIMRDMGTIDPENIEEYIWKNGYQGAAKALLELEPAAIIAEVKES
ncbi:MAG: NAD(P)H-dependent oxidoreductase subunit E, partial [Desulfohalobiaceae bacterium]|nr:NAD(P)H-dependent oxidoreductase subunit E [Desulfohalobiaceae bacterium]